MSTTTWAMIIAAVVGALVRAWMRRREALEPASTNVEVPVTISAEPDTPQPFGYRTQWLAIRSEDSEAVAGTLKLYGTQPANWATGLEAAGRFGDPQVWVSPPVQGWVFVVGVGLPDAGDASRPDAISPLLRRLARTFPTLRYFATDRNVDYHAWARLDDGRMLRQFAYLGDQHRTLWRRGKPTPEEADLIAQFLPDELPEGDDADFLDRTDLRSPDEEDVIIIAERWCLNPMTLDTLDCKPMVGILGHLPVVVDIEP